MDDVLKQRLIGAAVLIALAVIFIPMFFSEPSDPALERTVDSSMPVSPMGDRQVTRLPLNPMAQRSEAPETAPSTITLPPSVPVERQEPVLTQRLALSDEPVVEDSAPLQDSASSGPSEPSTDLNTEATDPTEPRQFVASSQSSQSVTEQIRGDVVATDPGGWRVQVASFSAETTANAISESVRGLGYFTEIERLVRGDSVLYRVQTEPYANRDQAEAVRTAIAAAIEGVSPVVKAPEADNPAARAIAPGYAVQVGSFTNSENAERLVSQLISQGFSAFWVVESVSGRAIWRVRVGSVPDRDQAEALQARLRSEASLEGLVVSHP